LYGYLSTETRLLQEKYEENNLEIEACEAEKQRVQLEEWSNDYFLRESEHEKALKELATAEAISRGTEAALQGAKVRERIMQAARIAGEICRKRLELSGIEEKLSASREHYDTDGRLRSLECFLKIILGESLNSIAAGFAHLRGEKGDKERLLGKSKEDYRAAEREKSSLDGEKGSLEERKKSFEIYEKEVKQKLGIALRRNLLGEMNVAEMQKTMAALENARDGLIRKDEKLKEEKAAGTARRRDIDNEAKELQAARAEEKKVLNDIDRDIREYEQKEQEIRTILDKYGFNFDIRFDRERLASVFGQHVQDLEGRLENAARIRDDAVEALFSLKNGRLHTLEELVSVFTSLDIRYDMGETYLRNLPPEIGQRMIEGNSLLPYTLIISRVDIDLVANSVSGLTMRRVVPLIAYEDLEITVESNRRVARNQEVTGERTS